MMVSPPSGPRRTRWLVPAIALLVGLVVVAGAAFYLFELRPSSTPSGSPGPGPGSAGQIDLLPSPGTRSACIVGTPGVPRPVYPLDFGTYQGNTYSVPAGTVGHVGMCYGAQSGALFAYANWSHVGGNGGWFSYPQLTYGVANWAGADSTYTNQSAAWILPQQVSQIAGEGIWTVLNYSFHAPPADATGGYDFSLDDFFTDTLPPEFQQGPFVEVMVWFAHHITYPNSFVHWAAPTLVNSTVSLEPWDVGYWCHGVDNGSSANVSFDFSYDGQATSGTSAGTLGVNLSLILSEVEHLMPSVSCWTGPTSGFSNFYLDEANLGSEDGALGGADFNYNWTVTQYCFQTHVTNASTSDLDCNEHPTADSLASNLSFGSASSEWTGVRTTARALRVQLSPGPLKYVGPMGPRQGRI
jgi:hypothetical protein